MGLACLAIYTTPMDGKASSQTLRFHMNRFQLSYLAIAIYSVRPILHAPSIAIRISLKTPPTKPRVTSKNSAP